MSISQEIYDAALNCGYDNCGIIRPEALAGSEERLSERMKRVPSSSRFYKGFDIYKPVKERFPGRSQLLCSPPSTASSVILPR